MRTLMALFAHPDDESFAAGGTLAKYARAGVRVVLVCATRGEAGIVHGEQAYHPQDLGQTREAELRCACRVLGIEELRFLGYRDSGMAGAPDNHRPEAFVQADPEEVVSRILDLFRQFRPEVVLTFGPSGGYGHPDHVTIHRHTSTAWHWAADSRRFPDLAASPPRKLYYTAMPRRIFYLLRMEMWKAGLIEDRPSEEEFSPRDNPEITTRIELGGLLEVKTAALQCHRTQVAPDSPWLRLPLELRRKYLSAEYFHLADTRGVQTTFPEYDLFAGL